MNDTPEWKIINMIDVFEIHGGYYNKKPPMSEIKSSNTIPFLGASDSNNGITGFVKIDDVLIWDKTGKQSNRHIDKRIFDGNAIAVTNNGSVGHAYYMKKKFTCSHDINVLYLKNYELTKELAMFLITSIERSAEGFSYSVKWRPKRMVKSKILLPVKSNNELDWEFMENAGRFIYQEQKRNILEYIQKKHALLKRNLLDTQKLDLNDVEWGIYELDDLFKAKRVSGTPYGSYDEGSLPFVSTSSIKNGVQGFVSAPRDDISPAKSLTINPIDGTVFYQSYNFVGRGGAGSSIISLTNKKLNKYTGLFIKTAIERSSKIKSSYGVQLNGNRLKATQFKLPITDNKEPNWSFMEMYMKQMEYNKLDKLIEVFK